MWIECSRHPVFLQRLANLLPFRIAYKSGIISSKFLRHNIPREFPHLAHTHNVTIYLLGSYSALLRVNPYRALGARSLSPASILRGFTPSKGSRKSRRDQVPPGRMVAGANLCPRPSSRPRGAILEDGRSMQLEAESIEEFPPFVFYAFIKAPTEGRFVIRREKAFFYYLSFRYIVMIRRISTPKEKFIATEAAELAKFTREALRLFAVFSPSSSSFPLIIAANEVSVSRLLNDFILFSFL